MTLCIARRLKNGAIELASDSRISINSASRQFFDSGIKVFAIPATIQVPMPKGEDNEENYKGTVTFGLAVAGSTLHTYLVKEAVEEILKNLAIVPGQTNLNLENICRIIQDPFERVAHDIDQATTDPWLSTFLFTGRCLETRTYRAFRFDVKRSEMGFMGTSYKEILIQEDIVCVGSGAKIGQELYDLHPQWRTIWIVDEAIRSGNEITVGGHVQFGHFGGQVFDFYLSAIPDYTDDGKGGWSRSIYLRGVPVYNLTEEHRDQFLHFPPVYDAFRPDHIKQWNTVHPGHEFIR